MWRLLSNEGYRRHSAKSFSEKADGEDTEAIMCC